MITALQLGRLGRFCNGAFMIASCVGIAVKSGQPYSFPLWINWDAKERFGSTEDIEVYKHLANPLPLVPEGLKWNRVDYFWGFKEMYLPTGSWDIYAHLQSQKYFNHCMPLIRKIFTFTNEPNQTEWIGVHVRRGDYDNQYHPLLEMDYYEKAMEHFPGQHFVVFSDDPVKASQMFKGTGASIFPTINYLEDFKHLKKCKGFITANSTYSLFASILGDHSEKKVVCPENFFGPAWGSGHREMARDIYPENAIVL